MQVFLLFHVGGSAEVSTVCFGTVKYFFINTQQKQNRNLVTNLSGKKLLILGFLETLTSTCTVLLYRCSLKLV